MQPSILLLALLSTPIPPAASVGSPYSDDVRINSLIQGCPSKLYNGTGYGFRLGGCSIELSGAYFLRDSIKIDRHGVWISCAPGTTILIKRGTVPAVLDTGGAHVSGCWFMSANDPKDLPWSNNVVPLYDAHASFNIRDCTFFGGTGDGIRLEADASVGTIGDMWRLSNTAIFNAGGSCLYVHGGDSNTGIAEGNLGDHCCQAPADPTRCAAFSDASFLGNTYIANQAQLSRIGYRSIDRNARNLYLGNYSEGDEQCADISPPATWIGGLCGGNPHPIPNSFIDGVLRAPYPMLSPWQVPFGYVSSVPTSTKGHQIGETQMMLAPYGTPGNCLAYRLLPWPGSAPRWLCTQKMP